MSFKRIPKGCGKCSNKNLELIDLVVRCLKCGWSSDLSSINEYIEKKMKRRN